MDAGKESVQASPRRRSTRSAAAPPRLFARIGGRTFSDVNYITPTFILTQLPVGMVGLLILAIIMAATDTSPAS